jgi:hypothetical protein
MLGIIPLQRNDIGYEYFIDDIDRLYGCADPTEEIIIGGGILTLEQLRRAKQRRSRHQGRCDRWSLRVGFRIEFRTQFTTLTHSSTPYFAVVILPSFWSTRNHSTCQLGLQLSA